MSQGGKSGDYIRGGCAVKTVWRVGVVTVSDRCSKGEQEDKGGPVLKELAAKISGEVIAHKIVPDEMAAIEEILVSLADGKQCDLIVTTGGTGFTARDVTPEATKNVIQKEVPGLPEAMRLETLKQTRMAILSRAVAGIRGQTLIVNFPGNPKAVKECFAVIEPVLPHALQLLRGDSDHACPAVSAHKN